MGIHTDIDDLAMAPREKRNKWLWAIVTSAGTVIATTATVSWQMGHYIAKAEAKDNELRGAMLIIDKKLEDLDRREQTTEKELRAGIHDAHAAADKALLYAQLMKRDRP